MTTKIDKGKLLDIVTENRARHLQVFLEAWEGYKEAVIKELETALDDARKGKRIWRQTALVQPVNQTGDYDRAIRMLELNENTVIELDEDEFSNLVLNKWHWAKQFATSNAGYTKSAFASNYLEGLGG